MHFRSRSGSSRRSSLQIFPRLHAGFCRDNNSVRNRQDLPGTASSGDDSIRSCTLLKWHRGCSWQGMAIMWEAPADRAHPSRSALDRAWRLLLACTVPVSYREAEELTAARATIKTDEKKS